MTQISVETGLRRIEAFITASDSRIDYPTEKVLRDICNDLREIDSSSLAFRKSLSRFVDSLPGRRLWPDDMRLFFRSVRAERDKQLLL